MYCKYWYTITQPSFDRGRFSVNRRKFFFFITIKIDFQRFSAITFGPRRYYVPEAGRQALCLSGPTVTVPLLSSTRVRKRRNLSCGNVQVVAQSTRVRAVEKTGQ